MGSYWVVRELLIQDLLKKLSEHPDIISVARDPYFIIVRFRETDITEYWAVDEEGIDKRNYNVYPLPMFITNEHPPITIYGQFEADPLIPEENDILRKYFLFL